MDFWLLIFIVFLLIFNAFFVVFIFLKLYFGNFFKDSQGELEKILSLKMSLIESYFNATKDALVKEMKQDRESSELRTQNYRDTLVKEIKEDRATLVKETKEEREALDRRTQAYRETLIKEAKEEREASERRIQAYRETLVNQMKSDAQRSNDFFSKMGEDFTKRSQIIDNSLKDMTKTIGDTLEKLRVNNEHKLEEMRKVVDEKLEKTLEDRLSKSFKNFMEILDAFKKQFTGIENLSSDFKNMEKVFRNIKTRGIFGEQQLKNMLENVFAPHQYRENVSIKEGSNEKVEFVIVIPTDEDAIDGGERWLPIDAKFHLEAYTKFVDASKENDENMVKKMEKELGNAVRNSAKKISEKYIFSPKTTDYALLFLPLESLYIEVQRLGVVEEIWRKNKVMVVGPTNLYAIIQTFSHNFRLIAFSKSQMKAFNLLDSMKKEFETFVTLLKKSGNKIREAGKSIEVAEGKAFEIAGSLNDFEGNILEKKVEIQREVKKLEVSPDVSLSSESAESLEKDETLF